MKPVFPELRNLADNASKAAQMTYLVVNVLQLSLLGLAALFAGVTASTDSVKHAMSWTVSGLMAAALVCTIGLRIGKFDVRWFKCRAFAENAKSLAWRFAMGDVDDCGSSRGLYLDEWSRLKGRLPELQKEFAITSGTGELITEWMTQTSLLNVPQKVAVYKEHRVRDQIKWYAKNAKTNARRQTQWFWTLFGVEFLAVTYSVLQALLLLNFNLVGFIAAIGSGIVAWFQIKRHSDLSTSYAVAAEDLTLILEKFTHTSDQETLMEFVANVEEAVSREHSMWLARRDC